MATPLQGWITILHCRGLAPPSEEFQIPSQPQRSTPAQPVDPWVTMGAKPKLTIVDFLRLFDLPSVSLTFIRLFDLLNSTGKSVCSTHNVGFIHNFNLFWDRCPLFARDGTASKLPCQGSRMLAGNLQHGLLSTPWD